MRRPQGYAAWREGDDGNVTKERDTCTCGHCSMIAMVPPGCQPGDVCKMCGRAICERCAAVPMCRPFELHLQAIESKGRFLDAVGISKVKTADARRVQSLFAERRKFDLGLATTVNGKIVEGSEVIPLDLEFERKIRLVGT
jgi:hypothetical protein